MRQSLGVLAILISCAFAGSVCAQDVATVGTVTASGSTVIVPFYVRDVTGTALGRDQATGSKIQALSFRVSYSPAAAVSSVTFTRAGITAGLTPMFETSTPSGSTISYLGSFNETSNLIPFNLDQAAPGDQVLQLTFTLSGAATPGTVISLTIDTSASVTLLSNQAGSVSESTSNGRLSLVNGSITVPVAAPTVTQIAPPNGPATGGTTVTITGTGFQTGATVAIGGVAATGVSVGSSTSITSTTGAHAAGAASVVVTNPDSQSGTLTNGFTYTSVSSGSADLSISKLASPSPVSVGATLTYTLTVTNSGPDTATGVTATDPLPAGVAYVSATSTQGTCSINGSTVAATIGSMGTGSSVTVTITTTATTAGQVANTATVSGGEDDPNTNNNSATVVTNVAGHTGATADLFITKTDSPDPASVGSNLTYIIVVTNAGPDSAADVGVTDVLPAGVTFVSASTSQGSWTLNGGTVSCTLGSIAKGGSANVTIVVVPTTAGQLTNTASTGGSDTDPNTADNSATATTAVETGGGAGADLTGIWKKVKRSGSNKVSGRFMLQNTGTAAAGAFTAKFYYSTNQTVDGSDKLIQTSTVAGGLTAGASGKPIKVSYTGKKSVAGKYLIAVVDAGSTVGESNETNNTVVKQIP